MTDQHPTSSRDDARRDTTEWDLSGALRRIRRTADVSQRELASAVGIPQTVVAKAEARTRDLPVQLVARLAAVAGLRLALLDAATGDEVRPMTCGAVRDAAGRLLPAHLDTRHGDESWWADQHRPRVRQPRYTFDRDRCRRDGRRARTGALADHHVPQPGDSLEERAAARQDEVWRRRAGVRRQRFLDGTLGRLPEPFECRCPPTCEHVEGQDDDLAHAAECACRCDVG